MRPSIAEHNVLLIRYLMVFLIGYVLFTIHAGADVRKKRTPQPACRKWNREKPNWSIWRPCPRNCGARSTTTSGACDPAQFAIRRATTGQAVSELRWFTDAKVFTLSVAQDVLADGGKAHGKAWMLHLAEAIE